MVYTIYRSNILFESLLVQEKEIDSYLRSLNLSSDKIFTDFSSIAKEVDERIEFKEFLQGNVKDFDIVVVYDLWCLSHKAEELVKIFTCLFKKKALVHIVKQRVELKEDSPSFLLLCMINEVREKDRQNEISKNSGRPKGSISKSIFDEFRGKILQLLKDGKSINAISKILNVNRSSLKDYVHSRELKEIAKSANNIESIKSNSIIMEQTKVNLINGTECPFAKNKKRRGKNV